jgi:hypothetical protein
MSTIESSFKTEICSKINHCFIMNQFSRRKKSEVPLPFNDMIVGSLPLLISVVEDLNFFVLGESNASLRRQSLSSSRTIYSCSVTVTVVVVVVVVVKVMSSKFDVEPCGVVDISK